MVGEGLPAGSAVARAGRRYGSALPSACVRELEDGGNPGREAIALRSVELVPVRGEAAKERREPRVANRGRSRPRPGGGTPTSGRNGVAEPRTGGRPGASRAVLRFPDGEADAQRTADGVGSGEAGVMASQDAADCVSRQSVRGGRPGHRSAADRSGNRRAIVFAGPFHRGIYAMRGDRWGPIARCDCTESARMQPLVACMRYRTSCALRIATPRRGKSRCRPLRARRRAPAPGSSGA